MARSARRGYQFTPVIGLRANLGYAQGKTGAKFRTGLTRSLRLGDYRRHRCPEACNTRTQQSAGINFTPHADINLNNLIRPVPVGERRWTVSVSPGIYFQKFSPR